MIDQGLFVSLPAELAAMLGPKPAEHQRLELETLLDTLPMPVFFKDSHLYYRRANRAACAFLGLDAANIVGRRANELFPAGFAAQIDREDADVLAEPRLLISPDTPLADAGGDLHYFSTYKSAVIDDAGQVAGLLDLMLDVSDRKLAESERLTLLQSQRDALVQEVHHRIKNHLQGVIGLLQRIISANPDLIQPLHGVLAQIESIAGIHGLQSRLRGQQLKFGQVVAMIAELTPGGVGISGDALEAELPHQEAVPFALTLNELVSNAHKHCRTGLAACVSVDVHCHGGGLRTRISNRPATLPDGFNFEAGIGLGTGLRLLKTLLPSQGARLIYWQHGDSVVAELQLMPPLVDMKP